MQVYKGLDIVTAKATKSEQSMAKHHLIDVADAGSQFTVVDFRDAAVSIIDNLLEKKKIPILVGGTNYYIESVLWKVLVNPPRDGRKRKIDAVDEDDSQKLMDDVGEMSSDTWYSSTKFKGRSSAELHQELQSVDPDSAKRLHPNDVRKIKRALEVYDNCGKTLTHLINEQKNIPGGNDYG